MWSKGKRHTFRKVKTVVQNRRKRREKKASAKTFQSSPNGLKKWKSFAGSEPKRAVCARPN